MIKRESKERKSWMENILDKNLRKESVFERRDERGERREMSQMNFPNEYQVEGKEKEILRERETRGKEKFEGKKYEKK